MEPSQSPTHCTCGTLLAEGARFCHRCGRPVFEDAHVEESDSNPPPDAGSIPPLPLGAPSPPPAVALEEPVYEGPPEPIDLRNRMVVRLAFFTAAMLFPLVLLPLPMILKSVLLASGGFFAAWLYQRRTHSRLGYLNAFRLGWIAG